MGDSPGSPNFAFLASHDAQLVAFATAAERLFSDDPNTCLLKLRQFGELLAQRTAANVGLLGTYEEKQVDLLGRLRSRGVLEGNVSDLFHGLRKAGNRATHDFDAEHREALHQLRMARELAVWFHRTFSRETGFKPGPFTPPPDPKKETEALKAELERLRAEAASHRTAAEAAQAALAEEATKRLSAEERAKRESDERAQWEELATLTEAEKAKLHTELAALQKARESLPPASIEATIQQAVTASALISLDEHATRRIIDKQLRDARWEVDTETLTHARGVRPQAGKYLAIAEWPTDTGPADYVLFLGLAPVAVIEAKRASKDVMGDIEQAKRYGRPLKVPFLYSTNGRPYLRQLPTKSGIYFLDSRRNENHPKHLEGWHTPEGLKAQLAQDIDRAHEALLVEPTGYLGLRKYQLDAIQKVEAAIGRGQRELLVAMATGTGKTKTCIGLVYRLLKTKRFRRVLFLVDRSALGEQAENAFKETRLESLQNFTDIFDLKGIGDARADKDTKVHVCTIQAMVQRALGDDALPVDEYDCIVVDECHRGYLLDREMGDEEMSFRDQADYVSMYRRVAEPPCGSGYDSCEMTSPSSLPRSTEFCTRRSSERRGVPGRARGCHDDRRSTATTTATATATARIDPEGRRSTEKADVDTEVDVDFDPEDRRAHLRAHVASFGVCNPRSRTFRASLSWSSVGAGRCHGSCAVWGHAHPERRNSTAFSISRCLPGREGDSGPRPPERDSRFGTS